ncbi:MAG: DinB family protein [Gemmatimonadaceae bacterium]
MTVTVSRPAPAEYAPYYGRYIDRVPEGDVLELLERQRAETARFLAGIPEERAGFRYAPDKWSIKQVVGHLCDAERVFSYRALRMARGDATALSGFDQDTLVAGGNFDRRTLRDLAAELDSIRHSTIALFRGLDDEAFARRGTANDVQFTVRAFPYIMEGHVRHHVGILKERYQV